MPKLKLKRHAGGYISADGRVCIRREDDFQRAGRGRNRSMRKVQVWQAYVDGKAVGSSWDLRRDAVDQAARALDKDGNEL